MLQQWLEDIETLLIDAPGNSNPALGDVWVSTLARLGETVKATAKANRVAFDLFEDPALEPHRPFFVLQVVECDWTTPGSNAFITHGAIDVFYTEQTKDPSGKVGDPVGEGAAHKRSQNYFAEWVGQLMQWAAGQGHRSAAHFHVARIRMLVPPMRTPRESRDRDDLTTDYWWTAWRFEIGEG